MTKLKMVIILFYLVFPWCVQAGEVQESYIFTDFTENCLINVENGRNTIKLAGIFIPDQYRKVACDLVAKILSPKTAITLKNVQRQLDRHGYLLAQVYMKNGLWIQEELLKNGLALVYPVPDNDIATPEMFKYEKIAINSRKGYWKDMHVFSAEKLKNDYKQHVNEFAVVAGTVYEVNMKRDKVYINFSKEWKSDFSLLINKDNLREFKEIQLPDLKGKKIMVRGWLEDYNGPMIELRNSAELRVL